MRSLTLAGPCQTAESTVRLCRLLLEQRACMESVYVIT